MYNSCYFSRRSCRIAEIKAVAFDADDTLWRTHKIFNSAFEQFYAILNPYQETLVYGYQFTHIVETLKDINMSLRQTHGVNPNRWPVMFEMLKSMYKDLAFDMDQCVNIFENIYTVVPEVFPSTIPTLNWFVDHGIQIIVITQAQKKWNDFKLWATRLDPYFDENYRIIVDVDQSNKVSGDWKNVVQITNINPNHILTVGDNYEADVLAPRKAGFLANTWIHDPSNWSIANYRSTEVPKSVREVSEIGGVLEYLSI